MQFTGIPAIQHQLNENSTTFIAQAAHPSFGPDLVEGRVGLEGWRLRFDAGDERVLEIPLSRLEIAVGESGEISFADPLQKGCFIYTFDSRILAQQTFLQQSNTRSQVRALREQADTKWRVKVTLWSLAILSAIAIAIPIVMGMIVRALVARVPASVEHALGAEALAELRQRTPFMTNAALSAKLNTAVAPLLAVVPSGSNFVFYIADDDKLNAFALPDGSVVVTRGLLMACERPEEIAGVVAHEIAHVTQRHALRQIISSLGPFVLFELFSHSNSRLVGTVGAVSQLLVIQGFSQEHELEADAVGWRYMLAAHINPHGMIDLLKKLEADEAKDNRRGPSIAAASSHPATAKRIAVLESKWAKVKNKTAFIEFGKD